MGSSPNVERVLAAEEIAALADAALRDLAHRVAQQAFRACPSQQPGPAGVSTSLTRLYALAEIQRALDRRALQEAAGAARAGAGYPEIGAAWNFSRQGARRRWPGLIPLAAPSTPRSDDMPVLPQPYDVLLVEDDPADALLIEDALHEYGAARVITQVSDGLAALAHLRDPATARPDLIVLDLNMPRMNGRELLDVLKADPDLALIPTVILTTSAAPDDVVAAYSRHANAYVTKPVGLDEFTAAVRSIDTFFLETASRA